MYDHTLNRGRKHFCRYCLQVFSREEILKRHIKDCFKINGKQKIKMSKINSLIIISMVEESKYCIDMMEKLVMTRDFEPVKVLKTVLNIRFVIMFMLMVML